MCMNTGSAVRVKSSLCNNENYAGTHEDERTVLYKTKSLDGSGTKPITNPKTKTKTNRNPILTLTIT